MEAVERVYEFLEEAKTYYLATVEGDQPRVRPFGAVLLYDGRLYLQTVFGIVQRERLSCQRQFHHYASCRCQRHL